MRKIAILAIVCLATACGDVSGEVWFVPGWRTGFSSRDGCVRILKDIYPGQNIRVCSWDSLQPWQTAVRNSREFTGKLNQEIMRLDHSRRRDIILVGHSIGGEIVLERHFADHHRYHQQEMIDFVNDAKKAGAEMIVTTEKDAVRMPRLDRRDIPILFLRVQIDILSGQENFDECISRICFL